MEKSLPSSGDYRVRQAKRHLVLDIFLRRGATWKHVRGVRERWRVEARTRMPPPYHGSEYTPELLGPRPEEEFGEEAQQWHTTFEEWRTALARLYKAVVPEEARDSEYLSSGWGVFLSICVLFDPPDTRLVDFAEVYRWEYSNVHSRGGVAMNAPPIVWRRDSNEVEAAWIEFYEGLLGALLKKYVHPQGVTTEEAMRPSGTKRRNSSSGRGKGYTITSHVRSSTHSLITPTKTLHQRSRCFALGTKYGQPPDEKNGTS
jgi:hypothetical protein